MNKEEWESLVGCPGWRAMKKYLLARRERIKEQIADGDIPPHAMSEAVWRCQNLKDLCETTYEDINHFYYPEEELRNEPGQA